MYYWSPLTSGSRSFAVWPLLLPFTLINVAGWMGPEKRGRYTSVHRAAMVVLGLATTAASTVWLLLLGLAVWHKVDRFPEWVPGGVEAQRFWAAAASAAVAMAALVLSATFTAAGYDRFRPTSWDERQPPRPWEWPWGVGIRSRLEDPRFYDGGGEHRIRWRIHVTIAVATWLAVVGFAYWEGIERGAHVIGRALAVVGSLQAACIVAMTIVAFASDRGDATRRFSRRALGAAAATAGVILLGGLTLSAAISIAGLAVVPAGPAAVLYDCYGWAMVGALGAAVLALVRVMLTPSPVERPVTRQLVATFDARARARLATILTKADVVVVALGGGFAVGCGVAIAVRWSSIWDDTWRLTATPPVLLARTTFAFVVGFLILNLWKSRASPAVLQRIGNIWDVLTFWPRAYHPFAVRPYAERAVPELQEFLRTSSRQRGLVVAAHSQGTVLTYAALRPFVTGEGRHPNCSLPPVALVTFGSPLRALYQSAFPHYFTADEFDETRRALAGGWINCFRLTDHIGRSVFVADEEALDAFARGEPSADQPIADGDSSDGQINGHNDYWRHAVIRTAVASAEARLEEYA